MEPAGPDSELLASVAGKLVADAAAAEVVRALRSSGLPSFLLRGPAIARWLYDDEVSRTYADVDLLAPDDRLPDARVVLKALGFAESPIEAMFAADRPSHAETWARQADGVSVDLHRTLIGIASSPALLWETIASGAESIEVGGAEVDVPGPAARALFVALHAAQHGTGWGQPLEDLSRALERLDAETWRHAADLAGRFGATPAFAAGLRLLPQGESLAATLGLPRGQLPDSGLRGGDAFHVAQGIQWLLETPGLSRKAAFLARKLVPPPATMRLRSRLARRGSLGLGIAYVWRAVRLSAHGATTLPRLVRSRRAAGSGSVRQGPGGIERDDRNELR